MEGGANKSVHKIYTHAYTCTHNERICQNSIFLNVIFKEKEDMWWSEQGEKLALFE